MTVWIVSAAGVITIPAPLPEITLTAVALNEMLEAAYQKGREDGYGY